MSFVYSPADSRGWGVGNYLIGGALQPSDVYTVRVREHWRRKSTRRRGAVAVPVAPAPVVVASATRRTRRPRRAISAPPTTRVLRSARRVLPVVPAVSGPVVAPAVPAPAIAVPAPAIQIGAKRRRLA